MRVVRLGVQRERRDKAGLSKVAHPDVFCRLFSCPHLNRAAPFFRRLDGLAIQDGGVGRGFATVGTTKLFPHGIMNARPSAVHSPVPKVGVVGHPWREVMRQH